MTDPVVFASPLPAPQSPYRETPNPKHVHQNNWETMHIRVFPEHSCIGLRCSYKKMTAKKKPSTFDRECLCFSFTIALYVLFYTDSEYPISAAFDYFLGTMILCGWIRLAIFVDRWYLTRTISYWRWSSIVLHIACCVAWGGRIVLEPEDPSIVVVGQVLGFIGVWTCYGILRFALFLDKCIKAFLDRSFTLAWLSFQIQRLIGKKGDL